MQVSVVEAGRWLNTKQITQPACAGLNAAKWECGNFHFVIPQVIKGQPAFNCFWTMKTNSIFYPRKRICKASFCCNIQQLDVPRHLGTGTLSSFVLSFLSLREHCIYNYILHCPVKTWYNRRRYHWHRVLSIACCVIAFVFHAVASNYI